VARENSKNIGDVAMNLRATRRYYPRAYESNGNLDPGRMELERVEQKEKDSSNVLSKFLENRNLVNLKKYNKNN
jgi:hypothetical protein